LKKQQSLGLIEGPNCKIEIQGLHWKWRTNAGANYSLNEGLNYKTFKTSRAKMKTTIKHKNGADTVRLPQRFSRPPPPLHLQSMDETALFSGYKSQRTKGHRKEKKDSRERDRTEGGNSQNRGRKEKKNCERPKRKKNPGDREGAEKKRNHRNEWKKREPRIEGD